MVMVKDKVKICSKCGSHWSREDKFNNDITVICVTCGATTHYDNLGNLFIPEVYKNSSKAEFNYTNVIKELQSQQFIINNYRKDKSIIVGDKKFNIHLHPDCTIIVDFYLEKRRVSKVIKDKVTKIVIFNAKIEPPIEYITKSLYKNIKALIYSLLKNNNGYEVAQGGEWEIKINENQS